MNSWRQFIQELTEPQILADHLCKLAEAVPKQSSWLEKRAKAYGNHHAGDPVPFPPPVAIDWLLVKIDYNDMTDSLPVINMPEYRKAPGEETHREEEERNEDS